MSFAQRVAKLRQSGSTGTIEFIGDRIHERRQSATPEGGIVSLLTDITERRRAREQIEDLAKFPSENPNPVLRVTADGAVLYANEPAHGIGRLFAGSRHAKLSKKLAAAVAEAARTGERQEPEFVSGDRIYCVALTPVEGESYINIYGRDVTEEQLAKQQIVAAKDAAAAAESVLKNAIDNMSEGLIVCDSRDRIVICNDRYREMFPLAADKAVPGARFADLVDAVATSGQIDGDTATLAAWRKARWANYRHATGEPYLQHLSNGRWLQTRERRAADGTMVGLRTDVTELKRSEEALMAANEALRESETRFRGLVENIPGIVYRARFDDKTMLEYVSDAIAAITGYPPSYFIEDGHALDSIYHPDDVVGVNSIINQALADRSPYFLEYRVIDIEGRVRWLFERGQAAYDSEGNVLWLDGSIFDVTEQKQAEEAMARQKTVLEATLENMNQGIYMANADTRVVAYNERLCDLLDCPSELLATRPKVEDFIRYSAEHGEYADLPGNVEEQVQHWMRQLTSIETAYSYERRRPNGVIIEATHNPLPGGGWVSTFTDITERKRAEDALKESEERYALAMRGENGRAIIPH